jgi:hypothetical protein
MVAFQYRMGAGFAGDVNRTHPASIEPNINDSTYPIIYFGTCGIYTATGTFRVMQLGDTGTSSVSGVVVRQFPIQQVTATENWGEADFAQGFTSGNGPTPANAMDVLKSGYIMAPVVGTPVKGGTVYVWCSASSGVHTQGGFEATSAAGCIGLSADGQTYFNSGADSNGIAEIAFNL